MGRPPDHPPRGRRRSRRPRVRLPLLRGSAVRPGPEGVPTRVRGAAPGGHDLRLGPGQHHVRARGDDAVERQHQSARHEVAGAGADGGAPPPPRHRAGRRPRLARRVARPGAGAGAGPAPRITGGEVDGGGARRRCGGLAVPARRAVPHRARAVADPLPHRVAHAPGRGAARDHRARRRRHRPAGGVRLRGGVQPCVQARAWALTEPLARRRARARRWTARRSLTPSSADRPGWRRGTRGCA